MCARACERVNIFVCSCVRVYVTGTRHTPHQHTTNRVCVCVRVSGYLYVCVRVCVYLCHWRVGRGTPTADTRTTVYVCACVWVCKCICLRVICVCVYVYVFVCVCVYITGV